MNKKHGTVNILADALLAFLFAFPVSYLYNSVLERQASLNVLGLSCLAAVAFTVLFLYVRAVRHAVLTAGGLLCIILFVQLFLPKIALIRLRIYSLTEIMNSKAIPILICTACSIFAYIVVHYSSYFAFYAFIFVISAVVLSEIGYTFSITLLLIITASILLIIFKKNYSRFFSTHTNLSLPVKCFIPSLLAVSVLCTGIYALYRKRPETLNEPILGRQISDNLIREINVLLNKNDSVFNFSDSSFSISGVGFGSAGRLGGDARPSNEPLIYVYADSPDSVGVYLHGNTYRQYTGSGWEQDKLLKEEYISAKEILVRQTEYAQKYAPGYSNTMLYIIHSWNLLTKQLFSPVNTTAVELDSGAGIFNSANNGAPQILSTSGIIPYASKTVEPGQIYRLAAKSLSYKDLNDNQKQIFTRGFYENHADWRANKAMSRYVSDIRGNYLVLPINLPDRITELAESITANAGNDAEKAFAIQKFLTSGENGFEYTLTPGATPYGKDFVDYFLFETRKGYCTYYASAMTVMLRAVGVPARYAEGFYFSGNEEKNQKNYYTIRANQAHAWCEVYLEGLGFVPFEATPGFLGDVPSPTHEKLTPRPTATPDASAAPEKTEPPEPTAPETPTEADGPTEETPTPRSVISPAPTDYTPPVTRENGSNAVPVILITAGAVLLLLAVCTVLYLRSSRHVISKIRRSSPDIAVTAAYRYLSRRTKLRKDPAETVREFADKVKASDRLSEAQCKIFELISDMYEQFRYGNPPKPEENKEVMIECIKAFR